MRVFKKTMITSLIFGSISMHAIDYKAISLDELIKLRGNIPTQDIEIFAEELTHRLRNMNKDELKNYQLKSNANSPKNGHACNAIRQRPNR